MKRRKRLWLYLTLIVILGAALWFFNGKPLPWYWDYRRAEQAWLMEPKEVLGRVKAAEATVSRDDESLYLHTRRWGTSPARIDAVPINNGVGRFLLADVMLEHSDEPFWVLAWTDHDEAVRASVRVETWTDFADTCYAYEGETRRDGDLFVFELRLQEEPDAVERYTEADLLRGIYETECYEGYTLMPTGGYEIQLTFYDENGTVTGTHQSGSDFTERP